MIGKESILDRKRKMGDYCADQHKKVCLYAFDDYNFLKYLLILV